MDSARSFAASFLKPQSSSRRKWTQYWLTAPSSRKRASLSRSMTCASPFTTISTLLLLELCKAGFKLDELARRARLLEMVVLGDAHDNVHHIWHAAAAFGAAGELAIDLGRNHQLPGVLLEQGQDDVLDLLGGDHVALADEHGA